MIFKSSRGLRPAMVSGGIVAGLAGTWAVSPETLVSFTLGRY
jgi:import inner membrane translocase subunit TIM23